LGVAFAITLVAFLTTFTGNAFLVITLTTFLGVAFAITLEVFLVFFTGNAFLIIGLVLAYFYPITREVHGTIRLQLQERYLNNTQSSD
jgi:GPH family glycoside/pentoside/hexuronide:cation symporter